MLTVFWDKGCPHCAEEWEFLEELGAEFPDLEIVGYEIRYHPENRDLFVQSMDELGLEPRGVDIGPVGTTNVEHTESEDVRPRFRDPIRSASSVTSSVLCVVTGLVRIRAHRLDE